MLPSEVNKNELLHIHAQVSDCSQRRLTSTAVENFVRVSVFLMIINSVQGRTVPEVLSLEETIKKYPSSHVISPCGLAFYRNVLYVGSGIGLLEITNGSINKVYSWDRNSTSAEFPWHDPANDLLWVQVLNLGKWAYYDGNNWHTVNRPKPKHGYFSNADALEGFRFVSTRTSFYLQGGGYAWLWKGSKWVEEENPPLGNPKSPLGLLKRLIPADSHLYFIMRDERDPYMDIAKLGERLGINDNRLKGESAYYLNNGHWNFITNKTTKFLSQETAAANNKGYIRTTKGDLLEVTEAGIVKLNAPGFCEAIATSSTGTLLASFRRQGVFELKDQWHKLLDNPYPNSEADWEVCLTAAGEQIALSILPRPGKSAEMPNDNSRIAIWISEGQEWRPVLLH